jgi:hypothetical protein
VVDWSVFKKSETVAIVQYIRMNAESIKAKNMKAERIMAEGKKADG